MNLKEQKGKLISENKVEFSDIDAYDINFGISDIVKQKAKILEKRKIKHILDSKMISIFNKFKEKNSNLIKITILKINGELVAANLGLILNVDFIIICLCFFLKNLISIHQEKF